MMQRYRITFNNSAGELANRHIDVANDDELSTAQFVAAIEDMLEFAPVVEGDSFTVTVEQMPERVQGSADGAGQSAGWGWDNFNRSLDDLAGRS